MRNKEELMKHIWVTYHPKLQVYLKQMFPKITDQEDRASEILLKIFDKLDSYNSKYALSTWIYRIARNSQIDEIRKLSIKSVNIDDHDIPDTDTPEDQYIQEYDQREIKKAISKLKPHERELIYLYYYEEQNYREISRITGIPEGTLKYRMFCSRRKIRSMIERSERYERVN